MGAVRLFALVWGAAGLAACSFVPPTGAAGGGDDDGPVAADAAVDTPEPQPEDDDGDGVGNATDNCRDDANATQADEDGDGRGNVCDNCPHLANTDQADGESDGVGDLCDPEPSSGGNRIELFLGFDDPAELTGWSFAGNTGFVVAGGKLTITGTDLAIVWRDGLGVTTDHVTTEVTYDAVDAARQFRGATIMSRFGRSNDFGRGAGCGEMRDSTIFSGAAFFDTVQFNGAGFFHDVAFTGATVAAGHTQRYTVQSPASNQFSCRVGATTYTAPVPSQNGTGINFAVWGATASFSYLVVID